VRRAIRDPFHAIRIDQTTARETEDERNCGHSSLQQGIEHGRTAGARRFVEGSEVLLYRGDAASRDTVTVCAGYILGIESSKVTSATAARTDLLMLGE